MSLDFSFFVDDMVLEILGHLPALDIVRYRKVCRRIYQASKERSVWISVFSRAQCPLPRLDLETTSTQDIEKLLVRMEIMDAKWSGARPRAPQMDRKPSLKGSLLTPPLYDIMPPFLVETKRDRHMATYAWYRRNDLQNPILEYPIPTDFLPLISHLHSYIDIVRGALYIVHLQIIPGESPDSEARHYLKSVKFECSKENIVTKTLEHEIPLQDPGADERLSELSVDNGYAVLFRYATNHTVVEFFHLETGRITTCPVHRRDGDRVRVRQYVTPSHLIQLCEAEFAFFELPPNLDPNEPLAQTHRGSFPRKLNNLHFFPRSESSFAVIGLVCDQRENTQENTVHIYFLTLDLDQHSSACHIREDFVYEVKGTLDSLYLAPCSPSSRSTLGTLTVEVPPPTHTKSGLRIARSYAAAQAYHLAIRVDFGIEGRLPPSIGLVEMDELSSDLQGSSRIRSFSPYAGQIVIETYTYPRARTPVELVFVDYASM